MNIRQRALMCKISVAMKKYFVNNLWCIRFGRKLNMMLHMNDKENINEKSNEGVINGEIVSVVEMK
jgi:hypothetical protein